MMTLCNMALRGHPYMTSYGRGEEGVSQIGFHKQRGTNKTSDEGGGGQKRAKII